MVNLIKVKRTSIAVVVSLIILFYVIINEQVGKAKYIENILKGTTKTGL